MTSTLELFNAGRYADTVSACEQLIGRQVEPVQNRYIASLAWLNLGDFGKASAMLDSVPDASPEIANLRQFLEQSLATQQRLPAAWFAPASAGFFAGKTCLRIGGAVRMIDHVLTQAAEVIDVNATQVRFGVDNRASLIRDAHDLTPIADASIDFIASSHTIEHLVNPLLALKEWRRVLKPGGVIYSVIPNHAHTFDHRRALTTLEHLVQDLHSGRTETDWFHVCEFLREFDCERDYVFKGDKPKHLEEFIQAPGLHTHYHVFDLPLTYAMHEYAGFSTIHCFEADISVHWCGIKPTLTKDEEAGE